MAKFQFWLPTKLTRMQQRAVDERKAIFLSGVPGTGKTVVSIKRLQNADNAIIFTYGKLLRKTIEEKLNDTNSPVYNIHRWMWNIQGEGERKKLEYLLSDKNLASTIKLLKSKDIFFDEILVDEGQDLPINAYKVLREITNNLSISADDAQQINNVEQASDEDEILKEFSFLKQFLLDEVFRSAYELYVFAIQFVPKNERAHDTRLLERLQAKNSGADKPFVYIEPNLNSIYDTIGDIIDENPTDNIGILFERVDQIDQFERVLSKDFELSTYHSIIRVVPSDLNNIIITTFKSAKGIEFDIVIIPYFPDGAKNVLEEYYVGVTRAKSQVHFLSIGQVPKIISGFNKNSYQLINNRS